MHSEYIQVLNLAIAYGVSAIPATYFIGADGSAVAYGQGALTAESLQMGIGYIFSE